MRTLIMILVWAGLMSACHPEQKWQISGEWKEGEGEMAYLMKGRGDDAKVVDSVAIRQGKFRLEGRLERMDRYTLKLGKFQTEVFLDAQPIVAYFAPSKYDSTTMALAVKGSPEQQMLTRTDEYMLNRMMGAMFGMGKTALAEYDASMVSVVDSNLNLHVTALFLMDLLQTEYPFADLMRQCGALAPEVKASWMGQKLAEKLAAEKQIHVGGTAPDIALTDPQGKTCSLSELRGKWVIVDFWASWCGPCRKKFPELKALYDAYRTAGLEIYGVSFDDKKEAWTKAIADLELPWLHVSSLKGWDCPVAKNYRVTAVPKMFLLNPQGVIVGVDLPEQKLREKLDVLLNNK